MKVKDMSRNQQKAVFANMSDSGYLKTLEGAEKVQQRRKYLIKRGELAEDYEDKIFNVWNDKHLTHRQKLDRIAKLKKEAARKDQDLRKEISGKTVAGTIREEKLAAFRKKAHPVVITDVPKGHKKSAFDAIVTRKKFGSDRLFRHNGLFLTQSEYVDSLKRRPSKGARVQEQPKGVNRDAFDYTISKKKPKNFYIKSDGLLLDTKTYVKALNRKNRIMFPGHKKKASDMSYKELKAKGIKLSKKGDADKDGVENMSDCRPLNKKKQDVPAVRFVKAVGRTYEGYKKSKTSKARIKRAKEKLASIKRREKAERLEREAREAEQKYKKEHPKRFGVF